MKKLIYDICKKNKIIRKIVKFFDKTFRKIRYSFYKYTNRVDDKLVFFEAYQGKKYECSPKALYLELLNESYDYKYVWAFIDVNKKIDGNASIVKYKSKEYYKMLSKAKYIITNFLVDDAVTMKKNQVYVQCWHGTPLKKLRCDIKHDGVLSDINDIKRKNNIDVKRYSYFISPSKFCTEKFTSAFNLKALKKENIIIEEGYPRNDYLFKYTDDDVEKIKKELNINDKRKIILYAPTFRDNQHKSGIGYTYKLGLDVDKLKKELENDYIILFRLHYLVANEINFDKYKGFIYDVSNYDDISKLYVISDLLITDYSSVFFDYANLKRPILFYMYDLDEYRNKLRDFYIDLDELPGPIIDKEEKLIKEIKEYDKNKYIDKYQKFNQKFNYLDDKDSSKRVIQKIFK